MAFVALFVVLTLTMAIAKLPRWATIGLAFPLVCLNGWLLYQLGTLLQPVTSIVVTASLIAFLLDYPIIFFEKQGMARGWAIAVVLLGALLGASILLVFLGPLVWQQLNDFATRLPRWLETAKNQMLLFESQPFFQRLPVNLDQVTVQATNQLSTALETATSQAINVTLNTINSALNLVVTAIVSILLVINGERLWAGLLSWLPSQWQESIRQSLQPSFQGYFSGQATLALILSAAQAIAFVILDVPFGLLFGVVIGLFSLIPFGGTVAILLVSGLLVFQNIWLGVKVFAVALVLGQINDNVIAPRLIGGATGLNPSIVIIALLIGAKFAGFLGLLLAVPTTSFFKKMADIVKEQTIEPVG
jgi:predicted PurR-regulated permease PerM